MRQPEREPCRQLHCARGEGKECSLRSRWEDRRRTILRGLPTKHRDTGCAVPGRIAATGFASTATCLLTK